MKPRRRTILKVLCLLAAGAVLNVAVAWGLAALARTLETQSQPINERDKACLSEIGHTHPSQGLVLVRSASCIGCRTRTFIRPVHPKELDFVATYLNSGLAVNAPRIRRAAVEFMPFGQHVDAGWPLFSITSCRFRNGPLGDWDWHGDFNAELAKPTGNPHRVVENMLFADLSFRWPDGVIWAGFAINTLFYAGVL